MTKTIYRTEYGVLIDLLRERRELAGLTQAECSKAIGRPQSYMSDVERGDRRLDVVQLKDLVEAMGVDWMGFLVEFERRVGLLSREVD